MTTVTAATTMTITTTNGHDHEHYRSQTPSMSGFLYFYPDDVDALFDQIKDGVEVEFPPEDQPHGMREFAVHDPNGYLLIFGQEAGQ